MSTVISVENVSKYYRLGLIGGGTLSADLERWWARVRGKPDPLLKACPEHKRRIGQEDYANRQGEYIWALRDVSFEACPELVEGCSKAKSLVSLRLGSGQALAAMARAKAPCSKSCRGAPLPLRDR